MGTHPNNENNGELNGNKLRRDKNEREYFDVKILAFVLVDLVPYKGKNEMIQGFDQLFSLQESRDTDISTKYKISDVNEGGLSYFSAPIGSIQNLIRTKPTLPKNFRFQQPVTPELQLPPAIDRIDITVRQNVKFCYYVDYFCYINQNYRYSTIKNDYICSDDLIPDYVDNKHVSDSRRGPDFDTVVPGYENDVAQFLSKFSTGIFLNKDYSLQRRVPSVRIFSTQSIDFDNLINWNQKHWPFLEYLGINIYHEIDTQGKIYTFQGDTIYQKSNISKGINVLYSEKEFPGESLNQKIDTMLGDAQVFNDAVGRYLLPLYWSNYNIFQILESWKQSVNELVLHVKSKNYTLEELEEAVMETIDYYADLTIYENEERINIREARETFNINKNPRSSKIHLYKFKLFKDISDLIENCFNQEETIINDIEKQINALTSYFRDRSNLKLSFSNLSLQKRIRWFTISISIVGIIISVLPFIMKFIGFIPE